MHINADTCIKSAYVLVVVAGTFAAGYAVGRRVTLKVAEEVLEERLAKEIEDVKKHYAVKTKTAEFETPESAVAARIPVDIREKLLEYRGQSLESDEETPEEESDRDVPTYEAERDDPVGEFDWLERESLQARERPYIITVDEFMHNESEYDQASYTWFDGDETMADERDQFVSEVDKVIGFDNLRFGYGSGDPLVVYVRNDLLELEFEIMHAGTKYSEVIAGFIEHAERRKVPRFRGDDE